MANGSIVLRLSLPVSGENLVNGNSGSIGKPIGFVNRERLREHFG